MSKKLKYIIYIIIFALIFVIIADANSRYSNMVKDKTSGANTSNEKEQRQERNDIEPQNNDLLNNQNNLNNVSDSQVMPEPTNEYNVSPDETKQGENDAVVSQTKSSEKNFYIKSSFFDPIDTEKNTENVHRNGEWLIASTPPEGTKIYYTLIKGNKIVWVKSIVNTDNSTLKTKDVELESDKVELSYTTKEGESDDIVLGTDPKSNVLIIPSKSENLYFKNNARADNFKLMKKFTSDSDLLEFAVIKESKHLQSGSFYNKYYIYNVVNGFLYKNSYLFEDYTKPNSAEKIEIDVDSDDDYTTIEYKGTHSLKKRITTNSLKRINYQYKDAAPLTFEYKYKVENINTGVTISPK